MARKALNETQWARVLPYLRQCEIPESAAILAYRVGCIAKGLYEDEIPPMTQPGRPQPVTDEVLRNGLELVKRLGEANAAWREKEAQKGNKYLATDIPVAEVW